MSRLASDHRPTDMKRAARSILAWHVGDRLALDAVLRETNAEDFGINRFIFALIEQATSFAEQLAPGHVDEIIRAALLDLAAHDDEGDIDDA